MNSGFNLHFLHRIGRVTGELLNTARCSLFHAQCRLCETELVFRDETVICRNCRQKITIFKTRVCEYCGQFVWNNHGRCGECILQLPPFRKHVSFSAYHDEFRELILIYKYGGLGKLKSLFAECYLEVFKREINESFDYIISVPPDKGRKREYHPVPEAARIVARRLKTPLLTNCLIKAKKTPPQAGLSRSLRLKNLNGAFKLKQGHPPLKGKKLLLLDDIYTTGTTIKMCTRVLTAKGADVVALTLARSG